MKKTARFAVVAAAATLVLTACGDREGSSTAGESSSGSAGASSSAAPKESHPDFKACMVSDSGGFDDKSFNQSSHEGLLDAADQFGVKTAQVESNSDSEYADNIKQMVKAHCDSITTVGFLLADATEAAAKKNPDIDFSIVDFAYEKPVKNVKGLVFDTKSPSYLAGYLAAAESKSGTVGTFGGQNIPTVTDFMEGFRLGIEAYNKENNAKVKLLGWNGKDGSFTNNFEDKAKGKTIATQLLGQGADILFPVAGPSGLGGLEAAKQHGARAIWVDSDGYESTEYGDILLTSVVKGMDVATKDAIGASVHGEFDNTPFLGTLKNGGVSLAPYHDLDSQIDQKVKDKIEKLKQGLIDGSIKID